MQVEQIEKLLKKAIPSFISASITEGTISVTLPSKFVEVISESSEFPLLQEIGSFKAAGVNLHTDFTTSIDEDMINGTVIINYVETASNNIDWRSLLEVDHTENTTNESSIDGMEFVRLIFN